MGAQSQADGLLDVIERKDRELREATTALQKAKQVCGAAYNVLNQHDLLTQHRALADALLEVLL